MTRQEWPAEPTAEQCSANARLPDWNGWRAYACWYPQMGGYVGKCVVCVAEPGGCFEVFVWHDGEFPFDGEDECGHGPVRHLHHCMSEQFTAFGELVESLQETGGPPPDGDPVLDLPMQPNDVDAATVRDYLKALVQAVWDEGEGFSGKRPFGNGGWQHDLYESLMVAKLIESVEKDQKLADVLITGAIRRL